MFEICLKYMLRSLHDFIRTDLEIKERLKTMKFEMTNNHFDFLKNIVAECNKYAHIYYID